MREVSMDEPKWNSELTAKKIQTMNCIWIGGGERERSDKPVPGYEGRILHELTIPYGNIRRYPQDLAADLPRKYMHRIRLAHEGVPLVHVDRNEFMETDVDSLHDRTCAYVIKASTLVAHAHERRVPKLDRFVREPRKPQKRPGPEVPTRCIMMVHLRCVSGRNHPFTVRW